VRVSVVVLAHNRLAMTRRCLRALAAALDGTDHEVLCVDNASDEDMRILGDDGLAFARASLERNQDNLAFSTANNRAALRATGDWLLFLNNDVEVAVGSIRALHAFIGTHPEAGVCGARLVYPDSHRLQHAGMEQMLWGPVSNFGVGAATSDERFRHDAERFAVTGAMLCIRRDLFEEVGGFDEAYRWGFEDVDLCLKARRRGRQVWYVAAAEGVHFESATLRERRRPADFAHNYRLYRSRWDPVLVPAERAYLQRMTAAGIRRVVVFGTGAAGQALCLALEGGGIGIAAFTSTARHVSEVCGHPVIPLQDLARVSYDRLIVGSQYYFELEQEIRRGDPQGTPLFPALTSWDCRA
jgi:GT2 family glycosyltransferase